jgi:hypothetical protein
MMGKNDPAICDVDDDPGIVEPDELRNGRLPFLSKSNLNHTRLNGYRGREEIRMGKKHLYMDHYDEEVGMIGVDSVVMNDAEDGKNRMINMARKV